LERSYHSNMMAIGTWLIFIHARLSQPNRITQPTMQNC
jgi:hypothetical protein